MTEGDVLRASVAALIGVACLLVLLRWLPPSVALVLGAALAVVAYVLA